MLRYDFINDKSAVKDELSDKFSSVAGLIQANEETLSGMDNSENVLEFFTEDKVTV